MSISEKTSAPSGLINAADGFGKLGMMILLDWSDNFMPCMFISENGNRLFDATMNFPAGTPACAVNAIAGAVVFATVTAEIVALYFFVII